MKIRIIFLSGVLLLSTTACSNLPNQVESKGVTSVRDIEVHQNTTAVNINSAEVGELTILPGIGPGLAERIIEHRKSFGRFRKPEHLMLVRGIGDKRFRKLQAMIRAE